MMPMYDSIAFWPCLIMFLSSFCFHHLRLVIMPDFTPTHWMLNNHRDKGSADWEIFAECLREAMAQHGNFKIDNHATRDKFAYEDFMQGCKDTITVDGRSFTWPPSTERKNTNDDDNVVPTRDDTPTHTSPRLNKEKAN